MSEEKISVIVPVYNVEAYLPKCLDSICAQTYRALEIILVDDGSPDASGKICDEYAQRDPRIRVIHQENGGVSSARNAGLAAATGEWLGWVDSDDWIEPDMFGCMLRKAIENRADIVVCSRTEVHPDQSVIRSWEKEQILAREEALELLLQNDMMQNYLWDKLWNRRLFAGIEFPLGRTYEDIAVMHRLFTRAERVMVLPDAMYSYFQRSGSIVSDQRLSGKINHFLAAKQRLDEMAEEWPQFRWLMEAQCVASSAGVWCAYYANPKEEREKAAGQLREIADFARTHMQQAAGHMGLGLAGRIVVRLVPYDRWWSFMLARCVNWLYMKKNGRAL